MDAVKDSSHLYEVERSATFLVLQGLGEYDYVPLT